MMPLLPFALLLTGAFAQEGDGTIATAANNLDPSAQINPETGCYDSNKDCTDEVLQCSYKFQNDGTDLTFENLKYCIYDKVLVDAASTCCHSWVTVGQMLDPDYQSYMNSKSVSNFPTAAPVIAATGTMGDPKECTSFRISDNCMAHGSCRWEYWTRVCRPLKFDPSICDGDNRDCKNELTECIQREKNLGRTPQIRNLEVCIVMSSAIPQTECCKLHTNIKLTIQGPKRAQRPDRFDQDNCELYMRNSACKNQAPCTWNKTQKRCEPLKGIKGDGMWSDPDMSCGYKNFKLHFSNAITVTKRKVKTSCECGVFCESFINWVYRKKTLKCGCTNQPVEKVSRRSTGWWGSTTKHAKRRNIG